MCSDSLEKKPSSLGSTEPIGQLELLIGDEDKPDCFFFFFMPSRLPIPIETLYFQAVCVYAKLGTNAQ